MIIDYDLVLEMYHLRLQDSDKTHEIWNHLCVFQRIRLHVSCRVVCISTNTLTRVMSCRACRPVYIELFRVGLLFH